MTRKTGERYPVPVQEHPFLGAVLAFIAHTAPLLPIIGAGLVVLKDIAKERQLKKAKLAQQATATSDLLDRQT